MPFDSTPSKTLTKEDKLNRLLYHLNHATDREQADYCSCLAHRCYADPILQEAGLPKQFWFAGLSLEEKEEVWKERHERLNQWKDFFDIEDKDMSAIFSALSIKDKKRWIRSILNQPC